MSAQIYKKNIYLCENNPIKKILFMKKSLFLLVLIATVLVSCSGNKSDQKEVLEERYIVSSSPEVELYSIKDGKINLEQTMPRGRKVDVSVEKGVEVEGEMYYPVKVESDKLLYANAETLVITEEEAKAKMLESIMYVRTPASIITDIETSLVGGLADKGEKITVICIDSLRPDGKVYRYKVRQGKMEGYVYGHYLVSDQEEAKKNYMAEKYDPIHKAVKNSFRGGEAIGCDFYPTERVKFKNNKMPEACYSLYLNISPAVIGKIDDYIAYAKQTKINTFVIDIKDNENPGYKAEAMQKYSPTNYKYAGSNKEEMYKKAVKRLHEEGFYVVGRITCFKDSHLVKDHPEVAITEKATGKPFKHNKAYWPSPYDRKVWQFNVELAKEAVRKFGFNEINFDYVRFPDRLTKAEKGDVIDYHNKYNESKVQAIQRFVQYACDEIHAVGAYVSVDVFGEAANPGYTTAYGQYWPAISNVCDVICGMPYPDHFSNGYYGIKKPWNHPYELLKAWGERVQGRQNATPTPAVVRTWIQAYPVMKHVDKNGLRYDAEDVEKEIRGLYAADLTGGFITWHSGSNLTKYKAQKAAFCIDYLKEWKNSKK